MVDPYVDENIYIILYQQVLFGNLPSSDIPLRSHIRSHLTVVSLQLGVTAITSTPRSEFTA